MMNYYLSKYVGTYRVMAEIDQRTNDFCRNDKMELENNQDIYIKCANGIRIYHYGGNALQVYIPSVKRGMNVVKEVYRDFIHKENTNTEIIKFMRDIKGIPTEIQRENISIIDDEVFNCDLSKLNNSSIIYDIEVTDAEVLFKIKDKNLDKTTILLKPITSGAGISPFSSKNLPKNNSTKYQLSSAQIEVYKKITDKVPKEDKLKVGQITNRFISDIICKKLRLDLRFDVKPEMKKLMIKGKEYINFKGFWEDYIDYLKNELE